MPAERNRWGICHWLCRRVHLPNPFRRAEGIADAQPISVSLSLHFASTAELIPVGFFWNSIFFFFGQEIDVTAISPLPRNFPGIV